MVYLYNGILLCNKKKWSTNAYNTDEPWKHAKWIKPVTKHILFSFHLYEMSRITKFIKTEN